MTQPLVVKFGGDALATPERIARAARRIATRRHAAPVVAVASARRGVTDHLLGLVEQVRAAAGAADSSNRLVSAASDRAAASGEIVAASLLAVALGGLGVPARVLDAREAGLRSDGRAGAAALTGIRPTRIGRLLARGITPVVTGFQGWHRGRLTTLGRGGSDVTAVALAAALEARACELVKDPGALHTADPRLLAEARPLARASHRFVTELALAGATVIHHLAAAHAEQDGVRLRFAGLQDGGEPATEVEAGPSGAGAVVLRPERGHGLALVTLVNEAGDGTDHALAAFVASEVAVREIIHRPCAVSFLVPAADGGRLLRALHETIRVGPAVLDPPERMYACH